MGSKFALGCEVQLGQRLGSDALTLPLRHGAFPLYLRGITIIRIRGLSCMPRFTNSETLVVISSRSSVCFAYDGPRNIPRHCSNDWMGPATRLGLGSQTPSPYCAHSLVDFCSISSECGRPFSTAVGALEICPFRSLSSVCHKFN
jgi:hypothetical protein